VNLFLPNGTFGWIISVGGVLLFTVFTAYDVQRIQTGALVAMTGSVEKAAVIGALRLYLDFVNLFLFLLRLMGGRR
jgi:FtsH-binding integral membrane protein